MSRSRANLLNVCVHIWYVSHANTQRWKHPLKTAQCHSLLLMCSVLFELENVERYIDGRAQQQQCQSNIQFGLVTMSLYFPHAPLFFPTSVCALRMYVWQWSVRKSSGTGKKRSREAHTKQMNTPEWLNALNTECIRFCCAIVPDSIWIYVCSKAVEHTTTTVWNPYAVAAVAAATTASS